MADSPALFHIFFVFILVTTIAGAALYGAVTGLRRIEYLSSIPEGWIQEVLAPDPSATINFKLAIQDDGKIEQVHQTVLNVSDPAHQQYGQHLTRDELQALVEPDAEVLNRISSWLSDSGVEGNEIRQNGDWVDFTATVATAEELLHTKFYRFRDTVTGFTEIRTWEYSVPEQIVPLVRIIQPTTMFGRFRASPSERGAHRRSKDARSGEGDEKTDICATTNTPSCLRKLYGFQNFTAEAQRGNILGVSGYLEQNVRRDDVQAFLREYAPYAAGANFSVKLINGGRNVQDPDAKSVEANLDMQYAIALSYNAQVVFYSTGGRGAFQPYHSWAGEVENSNEPYLEQLRYLVDLPDDELPRVLTTSYGEPEQIVPRKYAAVICDLFAQLGARGVSVIFSSGDFGVGSACKANNGTGAKRFNAVFPASCPYVTSVGSTRDIYPERAAEFSSGGFSDMFRRPEYQEEAVSEYLSKLGDQWAQYFDSQGRGFPDVAAQGVAYPIYNDGQLMQALGTSASAPTFAGIISNLNDIRLSQGKSVLGFLNPWIYGLIHKGFTDVVNGGSHGCSGFDRITGRSANLIPYASWNASDGWDPVTGLGTPDFPSLRELLP